MHNGSAIFRIILQFAWLVAEASLNWVACWSCNWQNLRPFEGVFGHILHKEIPKKKHNNLSYPISLVFLPFVEKQASLLENLTMEVRYYVALADPLVFFCACVWKWGRFSNSRGLLPVLQCMPQKGIWAKEKNHESFQANKSPFLLQYIVWCITLLFKTCIKI